MVSMETAGRQVSVRGHAVAKDGPELNNGMIRCCYGEMLQYHQVLSLSEENIAVDLLWFSGLQARIVHK